MAIDSIFVIEVTFLLILFVSTTVVICGDLFSANYEPLWGIDHLSVQNEGAQVELLLDPSSGSGFRSKQEYCSGVFKMMIKTPNQKTEGIVTSFYLISQKTSGNHDEIDFEFMGTSGLLQTNIFTNDGGHREERIQLWFDPSENFHTYEISVDQDQILFKVDDSQIRAFKKNESPTYISMPLHVEASIWNGTWAGIVDWSKTPSIKAYYQEFYINGSLC